MPFSQLTFCGLSVRSFSANMGWGANQISQLTVQLVQDVSHGDSLNRPETGQPAYFSFGGFEFNGLLQKFDKHKGKDGNPVYEATVVDPREILEGTQIIIGEYGGASPLYNLINAYGYWEFVGGFGGSLANESGMPWWKILAAVNTLCNAPASAYGGPLTYRGISYGINLSALPVPNTLYRLSGGTVTLLEAISQVCEDTGHDFYVTLVGYTIVVKVTNRTAVAGTNLLPAYISAHTGVDLIRSEESEESRNEIASSFLVGGPVHSMLETGSRYSFWGYDTNGYPILGTSTNINLTYGSGLILQVPGETMSLNARGVMDIIGSTSYPTNTIEMRCAMQNYETWAAYINTQASGTAAYIFSPYQNVATTDGILTKSDVVNDASSYASTVNNVNLAFQSKAMRLYEYVKGYATEFYGKKFIIPLTFVNSYVDPASLHTQYNYSPAEGGWMAAGTTPLSLSLFNADIFQTDDGRFVPMGLWPHALYNGVDSSRLNPSEAVVESTSIYMKGQLAPQFVTLNTVWPSAAALVTFSSPVYKQSQDVLGDANIAGAILGTTSGIFSEIYKQGAFGTMNVRIWPEAIYPSAVAIPLKSNILRYGPWWVSPSGNGGKVKYEADDSLVPWNYGGDYYMSLAGLAKVQDAVSLQQVLEAGAVELAGAPVTGLGDILFVSGVNVTNIAVSYGTQGVTTRYNMSTFTPRFGTMHKRNAETIKRQGLLHAQVRKSIHSAIKEKTLDALEYASFRGFFSSAPKPIKRESSHEVMVGYVTGGATGVRVGVSTCQFEEAVAMCNADSAPKYRNTSIVGMNGMFRPFSMSLPATGDSSMSVYQVAQSGLSALITGRSYNPFRANSDIEVLAWGSGYEGLNSYRRVANWEQARPLALRGPLVLTSYGYDWSLLPTPRDGTSFVTDYLRKSQLWKTGPVELLWDNWRGVWSGSCKIVGQTRTPVPALMATSGILYVMDASGTTMGETAVWNWFSSTVPSGTRAFADYAPHLGRWVITALDC